MPKKNRITLSQVMAVLALIGILLSVVGTTWLSQQPIPKSSETPLVSGETVPVNAQPVLPE